jgi:pimeloyl-ACP methyl ester carboxylesterase
MTDTNKLVGYTLPVDPTRQRGTVAQGFVTPKQDKTPQIHSIPPKRVLPIIFIPGIMGSNLRMSAKRQQRLKAENNVAWRPDNLSVTARQVDDTPAERQLRLDPEETEVDIYDPINNPTGNKEETADQRNKAVRVNFMYSAIKRLDGPLLQGDLPGTPNPKTQDQKARERGWGEIYFDSYKDILTICENHMNAAFTYGSMNLYLQKFVAGVDPSIWHAHPDFRLKPLEEKAMRETVKGCWFPVHAMGYNWLKGNAMSGVKIASRIRTLINSYQDQGFQCEKVILVTHSMGGLVARAVIHPEMGNLNDQVLGVVHGAMPAMGAGTAYKRMRCGFEGSGIGARVLGYLGSEVTAVLANAQGGLELLPSQAYGNHWLQVKHKGVTLKSLPANGDPYEEIYKARGKWFSLFTEDWINPADLGTSGLKRSSILLDRAKSFHSQIASTYHDQSYAHYGADPARTAWHHVKWEVSGKEISGDIDRLKIVADNARGKLYLVDPERKNKLNEAKSQLEVTLQEAKEPGDQTVPLHSADAQLLSGKFKGVFRQTGYEHQASYNNAAVLAATLYSLFQIASTMKWSK